MRWAVASGIGAVFLAALVTASSADAPVQGWEDPRLRAIDALAFTPSLYFEDDGQPRPLAYVEATLWPGRGAESVRWAFAIERGCPGQLSGWRESCGRLMVRVVSTRESWDPYLAPTTATPSALSPYFDANLDWREADLESCPGAMTTLHALETVHWGWKLDESGFIVVGAPPDAITVKAVSNGFATYSATEFEDDGETSAWARRMLAVVQPCLKPSNVPAPWARHGLASPFQPLIDPTFPPH
jgi:hypothetical protein